MKLDPIEAIGRLMFGSSWIGDLYVELDELSRRKAEAFTERELDGGCVIPGSLRNVSQEAREQQAAFWEWAEQRAANRDRRSARVVAWRA